MVDPIIVDDIPEMSDADLITAYRRTDGTGDTADALLPEIERRDLNV